MTKHDGCDEEPRIERLDELAGLEPPGALEERVVAALRERRLLAGPPRRRRELPGLARLAAAAALVLVGVGAGLVAGGWGGGPSPPPGEGRYLLLLYEDAGFQAPAGAAAEYGAWLRGLREAGRDAWGAELAAEAAHLGESASIGTGRVAGLFVLEAPDLSGAAAVAATCPHVRYGGAIEVRPLVP